MTTDARRAIFCILLSSEDYLDAFERIQKLKLKSQEERDIVSVMFYCCSQVLTAFYFYSRGLGGRF